MTEQRNAQITGCFCPYLSHTSNDFLQDVQVAAYSYTTTSSAVLFQIDDSVLNDSMIVT